MEKSAQSSQLSEETIVAKVAELMETLDQVKKYNTLTSSLKNFALIVLSSIVIFLAVGGSIGFLNLVATLDKPQIFVMSILLLLIPIGGVSIGVYYITYKVNSIRSGEWREELSNGFPSALKILTELDWGETFDEISSGRVGYAVYSILKAAAYLIIMTFVVGLVANLVAFTVLHQGLIGGPFSVLIAIFIVYFMLRKDFSRRYSQIRALDNLLWELRWFSVELRRADF